MQAAAVEVQRTTTCEPVASMIVLLPLFVVSKLPAVTPLRGNGSVKRSRLSSATMLRGLPCTTACACTQSWRSPLASQRHGPAQV